MTSLSQKLLKMLVLFAAVSLLPAAYGQHWIPLGPDGGTVRSLAYDPHNPDRIFLGTSSGQLFLSTDNGASWSRLAHFGTDDDYVLDHVVVEHDAETVVGEREVENAAGKHIRRDDMKPVALKDFLILQPEERKGFFPLGFPFPFLPVRNLDSGVSVSVAFDEPLEAQIDECGWINQEFTRRHSVRILDGGARSDRTRQLQ